MDKDVMLQDRRITLKRKRPNPLFEEWLEELYEEAKVKKSKLEFMLKEALESLSKYPLPLESGAECAILKGFDKKLCMFLDQRVEAYKSQQSDSESSASSAEQNETPLAQQSEIGSTISGKSRKTANLTDKSIPSSADIDIGNRNTKIGNNNTERTSSNNVAKARKYKPALRSGGYAILVALHEHEQENPSNPRLKKEELIIKAQQHSEESFTRPRPESYYTAWSSMSRLINKGLVNQIKSKKTDYFLTEEGKALALELVEDARNTPSVNNIIFNDAILTRVESTDNSQTSVPSSQGSSVSKPNRVDSEVISTEMEAGSFDVILLIDKNETSGVNNAKDPTVAQFKKYPDLKHEYRSLKVGDFTWIVRHRQNTDQEFVLPYIVERKRMDDLGASVKDGRFHEQKFRLRKCGLPNVLYLVENFGSNKHVGLPLQSLKQALANTTVQDGFKVHITDSLTNTARFLAMMTKRLTLEYKDKHLIGRNFDAECDVLMTFDYFNKSAIKNKPLTVTETFIKLLLQLKGVSVEKALAITKVYSTPKSLIEQYESCSQKEGENLLASLKFGDLNCKVGPSVSKSIYKFFVWRE